MDGAHVRDHRYGRPIFSDANEYRHGTCPCIFVHKQQPSDGGNDFPFNIHVTGKDITMGSE